MTTADAQFYWTGHPATEARLAAYRASVDEPYRDWAVDAVLTFTPRTVFEVGCHCGPLLKRLERSGLRAMGIDINEGAVAAAQAEGLSALVGRIPSTLDQFGDCAFDVVVTSYCLAYIAPEDLPDTLAALLRITRDGFVIVEPMAGAGVAKAIRHLGSCPEWRHDYLEALDSALPRMSRPPHLAMTRTAKGPYADINGVVTAALTWPQ